MGVEDGCVVFCNWGGVLFFFSFFFFDREASELGLFFFFFFFPRNSFFPSEGIGRKVEKLERRASLLFVEYRIGF